MRPLALPALLFLLSSPASPAPTSSSCPTQYPSLPTCSSAAPPSRYSRKEISALSSSEWDALASAIWTVKNTSLSAGRALYGDSYKDYDYFVTQHATAIVDSRGDQGHFSDAFPTWHALFLLSFEANLRLIDQSVSLAYWNMHEDNDQLTPERLGSSPGTGPDNTVVDGAFANWAVNPDVDLSIYAALNLPRDDLPFSSSYTGGGSEGFLRGPNNPLDVEGLVRFGGHWSYSEEKQAACLKENCWGAWFSCIESNPIDVNFHTGAHFAIGGSAPDVGRGSAPHVVPRSLRGGLPRDVPPPGPVPGGTQGDFKDLFTSPNDPIWWFHHANIDRNRINFMSGHSDAADSYYGFGNYERPGIALDSVANELWAFGGGDLGLEGSGVDGYLTHADALCQLGPLTAPYYYEQ